MGTLAHAASYLSGPWPGLKNVSYSSEVIGQRAKLAWLSGRTPRMKIKPASAGAHSGRKCQLLFAAHLPEPARAVADGRECK